MKKILFSLLASLLSLSPVQAQRLVAFDRFGTNWASTDVSTKNKPNGYIYRLRKDVQCDDLPRVPETESLELFIAEPIDIGWLGFYRLPTGADNYDFVVVLFNQDKQPTATINLCDVSNNTCAGMPTTTICSSIWPVLLMPPASTVRAASCIAITWRTVASSGRRTIS